MATRAFVIAASSFIFLGCSSSGSGTGPCSTSGDCEAGEACVDGACVVRPDAGDGGPMGCLFDDQCLTAHACVDARCIEGACFLRGLDDECGPAQTCNVDEGCAGGAPDAGVGDSAPLDGASADAGPPGDAAPADAGSGDATVAPDATPDAGPSSGALGSACERDRGCDSIAGEPPFCLDGGDGFVGRRFTGGYCTALCSVDEPDPCGPGAFCWRLFGPGYCVTMCESDADCRTEEGYSCIVPSGAVESVPVCLPSSFS